MTVFITIVAGVSVFVLGQIVLKWMIEPVQELRKTIAEVMFHLANGHSTIQGANIVDKERALAVCATLERLGASLLANRHLIPFYDKTRKIFRLPESEKITTASKRLSLISNSMFSKADDIHYRLDLYRIETCEALGIEDPIQGGLTKDEIRDGIKSLRGQTRA